MSLLEKMIGAVVNVVGLTVVEVRYAEEYMINDIFQLHCRE